MTRDPSQELPRIPELEGEYELVRELGRGGTAVVYLARDRDLSRDVAIKLMRPSHLQDEEALARLVREARTVGQLQHPNIVMLLGTRRLGEGGLALILQFVPGRTLKERIREEGPLSYADAERILRDLGRALAYAHRRRIVHRDIKPENVYLDDDAGVARLADFGIARAWDSDSGLTLPGTAIGTPSYMSPEQVDGRELDGRSDLYSLGLVGWEILTGRQPWAGEGLYNVIYKQKHEELPSLTELRPGTPANLQRAIARALEKEPEHRWRDADEFLDALADGSVLPPEVTTPAGLRGDARGHTRPPSPDARTIRYRRPGEAPIAGAPDEAPSHDALGDDTARVLDDLRARIEGSAPAEDPSHSAASWQDENQPASPGPGGSLALPPWTQSPSGQPGTREGPPGTREDPPGTREDPRAPPPVPSARQRRKERRRQMGIWVAAAMALLVVGGVGAAAIVQGPDGTVRSLLGQILPSSSAPDSGDDQFVQIDDEPFGTWRPPEGAPPDDEDPLDPETDPDPGPGEPGDPELLERVRQIVVMGLSTDEAPAGGPLPGSVVIRVEGQQGEGLAGVPVLFRATRGAGTPSPARATTGEDGTATVSWNLGPFPGEQELQALVEGRSEVAASVVAQALPRIPASVQDLGGSGQSGTTGQELPAPLEVRVTDQEGRSVAGRWVRFQVADGGGSVTPDSVATDAQGVARARWSLGPTEGAQVVQARVAGAETLAATFGAEASAPALAVRASVTAGGTHSCRLQPSGAVACWGDNSQGQLGDGTTTRRSAPGPSVPGGPFVRLATGLAHTCALDAQGRAHCWGANDRGQLGDGTTARRTAPVAVAGEVSFTEIEAGASHTCGLSRDGRVLCWGANGEGQLGDGTSNSRSQPTPVDVAADVRFRRVALGWRHSCALTTVGAAYCWGTNSAGELGRSAAGVFTSPMPVAGGHGFTAIAAGNQHTCGLTGQGQVLCWGDNQGGQLGDGSTESHRIPTQVAEEGVPGEGRFTALAAGALHTCAISADGPTYCWGRNLYGQIGDGSTTDRTRPTEVEGSYRFQQLQAFGSHTCGRTPGGDLLCWGYNAEGQIGDGSRSNRTTPVPVAGGA